MKSRLPVTHVGVDDRVTMTRSCTKFHDETPVCIQYVVMHLSVVLKLNFLLYTPVVFHPLSFHIILYATRRSMRNISLAGSLPSELGTLTRLTSMYVKID